MPQQLLFLTALGQTEKLVFPRRPEHHARPHHRQQLIAARIFKHAAQREATVYQHAVIIEIHKAFASAEQDAFVLHRQAGILIKIQRTP